MSPPTANRRKPADATDADLAGVLALNLAFEHWLSPLDSESLATLHRQSAYHRVIREGGVVVAFLLALREGSDYGSPNYRWFAERYPRFLYIDRVVVAAAGQGRGLGERLYRDLFIVAREQGVESVCCEYDLEPPNPGSQRFHERMGFREVGRQQVAGGRKQVSLQQRAVRADN